eukprot:GCRY01002111.1.p1 GENE.GCRY01002111.1~~GCRY01002111.1.p1  ORF type:complete len:405 (+),score=72.22 GCRY01002111.1:110-1324(+)
MDQNLVSPQTSPEAASDTFSADQPEISFEDLPKKTFHKDYVFVSVLVFHELIGVTISIFNKWSFKYLNSEVSYAFPITQLFVQLFCIVLVIFLISAFQHIRMGTNVYTPLLQQASTNDNNIQENPLSVEWVFRPGFISRCRPLFVLCFIFAVHMILNNLGLWFSSFTVFILLKGTSIFWLILFSSFYKRERPTLNKLLLCIPLAAGGILASIGFAKHHAGHSSVVSPGVALAINVVTVVLEGSMVPLMRNACLRMQAPITKGGLEMGVLEVFFVKMLLTVVFIFFVALGFELQKWRLIADSPNAFLVVMGIGVFITLSYHLSGVLLATVAKAVTSGVISQWKMVPQLIVAIVFFDSISVLENVYVPSGLVLVLLSSLCYGYFTRKEKRAKMAWKDNNPPGPSCS